MSLKVLNEKAKWYFYQHTQYLPFNDGVKPIVSVLPCAISTHPFWVNLPIQYKHIQYNTKQHIYMYLRKHTFRKRGTTASRTKPIVNICIDNNKMNIIMKCTSQCNYFIT